MARKWTDYPGRVDDRDNLNYWAGRSWWVSQQYREGRAAAAELVKAYPITVASMNIAKLYGPDGWAHGISVYFQLGFLDLLSTWRRLHGRTAVVHGPW